MVRRIAERLAKRLTSMARTAREGALALWDFLLGTHVAQLARTGAGLWRHFRLLSLLVFGLLALCLFWSWSVGARLLALFSVDPTYLIGPWLAAILAGLVILELTAASALGLIQAALRLAYDFGRHRIGTLLWLAFAAALLAAGAPLLRGAAPGIGGSIAATLAVAASFLLALWFQRTYRSARHRAFRDFWCDVVSARHVMARPLHGG